MRNCTLGKCFAIPLLVLGLLASLSVTATPPLPTRLVALFLQKERSLHEAMAKGDLLTLDTLVSRDFEARPGDAPAHPIPRANWLQGSSAESYPGRIEQLSARSLGSAALVSFVWLLPDGAGRIAVLDLWDGEDENAHLLVRHATPIGTATLRQGEPDPVLPKKH